VPKTYSPLRILTMLSLVLALVGPPTVAHAQSSRSWESDMFGLEVTWARGWEINEEATQEDATRDVIGLFNEVETVAVAVVFLDPEDYADLEEVFASFLDEEAGSVDEVDSGGDRSMLWWIGEDADGFGYYAETREVGDAIAIVLVAASVDALEAAMLLVAEDIEIDGEPAFELAGSSSDEPATGGGATADGEYVAWTHPTAHLAFDPDLWEVGSDESGDDRRDGRDVLVLGYMDPGIEASLYVETYDDYDGDPVECLEVALEESVGDATTRGLDDENGDPIEGEETDRAWTAVSYRNADGDRIAVYVDCTVLPDGQGVVVVSFLTSNADFEDIFPDVLDVVDSIEFVEDDGGSTGGTAGGDDLGGVIALDPYGVEITYDEDLFVSATASEDGGAILFTDDGAMFFVFTMEIDRTTTAADCVDAVASVFSQEADDLAIVEDENGDPIAVVDDLAAYALFTYTFEREDQVMVASCTANADEEAFIVIVGLGPVAIADTVTDVYVQLVEGMDMSAA
jgi:hypothetical protein